MAKRPRNKGYKIGQMKRWSSSVVHAGTGPNTQVIKEYYERLRTFEEKVPETLNLTTENTYEVVRHSVTKGGNITKGAVKVRHPRSEVLEKRKVLLSRKQMLLTLDNIRQGVAEVNHINILKSDSVRLDLYFVTNEPKWFFLIKMRRPDGLAVLKKSIIYASKESALSHFKDDSILWIETLALRLPSQIPSLDPPD